MADKIKKSVTAKKGSRKSSTGSPKKTKTSAAAKDKSLHKKAAKNPPVKAPGKKKVSLPKKTPPGEVLDSNEKKEIAIRDKKSRNDAAETDSLPVKKSTDKNSGRALSRTKKKSPEDNLPATVEDEIDPDALHRGDTPMSLVDHLDEFRSRILVILGTLIVLTAVGITFSDYLIEFINKPFVETGQKLNVFKLMGGFMIRLKASAVVALLITIPFIFYHAWKFIVPAINKEDRMFSRLSLLSAILLFYGGMAFVFFGLIPFVLRILIQFIPSNMLSTIGADDYLSFILLFSIAMGVLFELPIIVLILTRMGILTPQFLIAKRKIAVVLCFIIGGFITPQDPFSMFFVAIPLWFLYEISIFVSRFVLIRRKKRELKNQN